MTARSKHRGHDTHWCEDTGAWVYTSDGTRVSSNPERRCGHCQLPNREDGHDACLGELEGVRNACCGHGIEDNAYVQLSDPHVRGPLALAVMETRSPCVECCESVLECSCCGALTEDSPGSA